MEYILTYVIFIAGLYYIVGYKKIWSKLLMFKSREYWINYNTIEFASWMAKAIIIVPGLIFGIELWYMHFFTLLTSSLLIWASMRKSFIIYDFANRFPSPFLTVYNGVYLPGFAITHITVHLSPP